MTPERWQKLKQLCHSALEREPSQRAPFLAEACLDDGELRREAESMIARATTAQGILDVPIWEKLAVEVAETTADESARRVPAAIGRYRILRVVGEGGMGVVYEAEQDQPRRIVALKVIRPGLAGTETLRRFARESQALGRLHHVGIAQVYEAGTSETGFGPQPYFAMEFIHGTPLRQYADSRHLGTRERLEMMAKICEAVEHAHQNGIIHRDLKPGNILMDETGQPKILDFGVARLTDSDAQATITKQTDLGQLVGTLAYMSPEQVLGDPTQLDSRSDVYALGVILYELLAQRLPYEISDQLYDAVRTIREEDPKRLSSISRVFRGDVETIVAKALEKDKARRYGSAAALLGDIRKYLADEPITARPASTVYQLQKFAQRHKALVTATAVVFVVLVAGIIVSTREAVRARRAEQISEAVKNFLQNDLLSQAGPSTQSGPSTKPDPDLKVRTALDRAAARLTGKFNRQPELEAAIRDTVGQTYMDLGVYPEARTQLELGLDLYRQALGDKDPKTLRTASQLGRTAYFQGRLPEAEALFSQALETQRRVLGSEHPDTLYSLTGLTAVYYSQGKYAPAEALCRQLVEARRRILGPEHPDTLKSMNNLAVFYEAQGKFTQAESLNKQLVEVRRRVSGPEHPDTLSAMNNLANVYNDEGEYAQAEALYGQTLEIRRRVLGPEHPDTLICMGNLAEVYGAQAKYRQAEALDTQILEIRHRVLGSEHRDTLLTMSNLALIYWGLGKYAQAEALDSQAWEIRRRVLGPEHPDTLMSMNNLAVVYGEEGKYAQAEALDSRILEIRRRVLGPEHPDTLMSMGNLAHDYCNEGKYAQAEALDSQTLDLRRRVSGSEHPDTLIPMNNLADDYADEGKNPQAEALFGKALEISRRVLGAEHPQTLSALAEFAIMYQRQGKYFLAEKYAAQVLAARRHALGGEHPDTRRSEADLALAYLLQRKFAESEPLAREATDFYQQRQPHDWQRFRAESLLGASLAGQKKYAEAEPLLIEGFQGMLARKERIAVPDRYYIDHAHEWLVQLYTDWGKPEKAAEWRKK
jgi:serine/threonine protein kinase